MPRWKVAYADGWQDGGGISITAPVNNTCVINGIRTVVQGDCPSKDGRRLVSAPSAPASTPSALELVYANQAKRQVCSPFSFPGPYFRRSAGSYMHMLAFWQGGGGLAIYGVANFEGCNIYANTAGVDTPESVRCGLYCTPPARIALLVRLCLLSDFPRRHISFLNLTGRRRTCHLWHGDAHRHRRLR